MLVNVIYTPRRFSASGAVCSFWEMQEVQQRLADLGYYRGARHGVYDDATRAAVTAFQKDRHLPASGTICSRTYLRLYQEESRLVQPVPRPVYHSAPSLTIIITKSDRQLTLYNGRALIRQYPVAIGKPATPTPEGNFAITTKVMNPGGVLGTRWMGLNYDSYGIHGTSAPWLIGQMVSNGCIRMHNAHVEDIYNLVRIGTPVLIRP